MNQPYTIINIIGSYLVLTRGPWTGTVLIRVESGPGWLAYTCSGRTD